MVRADRRLLFRGVMTCFSVLVGNLLAKGGREVVGVRRGRVQWGLGPVGITRHEIRWRREGCSEPRHGRMAATRTRAGTWLSGLPSAVPRGPTDDEVFGHRYTGVVLNNHKV